MNYSTEMSVFEAFRKVFPDLEVPYDEILCVFIMRLWFDVEIE